MDTIEGAIPIDQFIPDEPSPAGSPTPEGAIPVDQFKEDDQPPSGAIPVDHFISDEDKYETGGQQALSGLEGLARGASAGLTDTLAVKMREGASALGMPDKYLHYIAPQAEDIYQRKEHNPVTSMATEIAGNLALMKNLPQMGSKVVNSMLQMGLIAGGDELSSYMLGHGDPAGAAAAHIAGSTGLALLTHGASRYAGKYMSGGLRALEAKKIGDKLPGWLVGISQKALNPEGIANIEKMVPREILEKFKPKDIESGQKFYDAVVSRATGTGAKLGSRIISGAIGDVVGGPVGLGTGIAIEQALEYGLKKLAPKVSPYVGKAILKAASSGVMNNLSEIIDHATTMEKGAKAMSRGVEALFKAGGNEYFNYLASEKEREKLRKYMDDSGGFAQEIQDQEQQPEGFAKGGEINQAKMPNVVAEVYPDQNIALSAARGRVSNYLNSMRPVKNGAKLPYDADHRDPEKEREYNKVLDLANQPLSILKHIKDGSLLPKHVKHMTGMYPELHQELSKKITAEMTKHQLDETKKPPYKVRQALSLFLGTSLDSTTTPASIMAAQNVFAQQKAQRAQPMASSPAISKMDDSSRTPDQARTQRLNKA